MGIIEDYFIRPIVEKTGYNIVNTLTYAAIALGSLYLIYHAMKKYKAGLGREFWLGVLAFVLFGSSIRVVTDALGDGGGAFADFAAKNPTNYMAPVYAALVQSHALDYGYWTVTPGIYIVVAALFLASYAIGLALGRPILSAWCGAALAIFALFLLHPLFVNFAYAGAIVALAAGAGLGIKYALKLEAKYALVVFAHALDGAATWIAINWFGPATGISYFEQHVVSGFIGTSTPLGFGLFFVAKVAIAATAVYMIRKEKLGPAEENIALAAIVVLGLAPGLRDMLRLLAGV